MIKRLEESTQPKPARGGLQHVSAIVERLLKYYELQADMNAEREVETVSLATPELVSASTEQSTFGWYQ